MPGRRKAIGADSDKSKKDPGKQSSQAGALLMLHGVLLVLSLSGIMSKMASRQEPMSPAFIGFYGAMLVILAFYALVWQQVIKRLPLTLAYANRAVTVVWGILWGYLFFDEAVTPLMLVGAAIIICGIVLFVTAPDGQDLRSDEAAERTQTPEDGEAHE